MEWKILGELLGEKLTLVLITFEVVHPLAYYRRCMEHLHACRHDKMAPGTYTENMI
jgi:hypothetical protein